MNERLRDLMLQAGYAAPELAGRAQKLAELIIKECLTFVEPMPGSGDIDDLALEAAYNQIKDHFGVEE